MVYLTHLEPRGGLLGGRFCTVGVTEVGGVYTYITTYVDVSFKYRCMECHLTQDVWPAPPGTSGKDKTNVRLGMAYVEFTSWAKEFHVERLGANYFFGLVFFIIMHASTWDHMCMCMQCARHSQPEFCVKTLRDVFTGYAEMACKGHNVA